jgi:hypothetical protein
MPFRPARQVNLEPTKNLPRFLVDIANNPRPIGSETTHTRSVGEGRGGSWLSGSRD